MELVLEKNYTAINALLSMSQKPIIPALAGLWILLHKSESINKYEFLAFRAKTVKAISKYMDTMHLYEVEDRIKRVKILLEGSMFNLQNLPMIFYCITKKKLLFMRTLIEKYNYFSPYYSNEEPFIQKMKSVAYIGDFVESISTGEIPRLIKDDNSSAITTNTKSKL